MTLIERVYPEILDLASYHLSCRRNETRPPTGQMQVLKAILSRART